MATISEIFNTIGCGSSSVLGTGTIGCKPFLNKTASIWLFTSGTVIEGNTQFNLESVQALQAEGKLIILKGIENFTDNTPDNTTEEFESGIKKHVRKAKYEFTAQFSKGMYFNSVLDYLNSDGSYDCALVDVDGNVLGAKSLSDGFRGFTLGMLQKTKLTWATDSTAQREGISFQLTVPKEVDRDYFFIDRGTIDFDAETLDGINEIVLALSVPTDGSTSITVKAKRKQDGGAFTGAAFSDFLVTKAGVTANPAGGSDSVTKGTYVLTGVTSISTGDSVSVRLYDNPNNRAVINLANALYKSNVDTEVAIA